MGNLLSCAGLPRHLPRDDVVKLVHSNGLVEQFYRAVRVAELSVDYPHHFICSSGDLRQLCRGADLRKLSEEDSMQLGQIYFLLPSKAFDLPLTPADVAALVSKAGVARKASYKDLYASMPQTVEPLAMALDNGQELENNKPKQCSDAKFSKELIHKLIEETRMKLEAQMQQRSAMTAANLHPAGGQLRFPELQTSYAQYMLSRSCAKLWRPSLETIKENHSAVS